MLCKSSTKFVCVLNLTYLQFLKLLRQKRDWVKTTSPYTLRLMPLMQNSLSTSDENRNKIFNLLFSCINHDAGLELHCIDSNTIN